MALHDATDRRAGEVKVEFRLRNTFIDLDVAWPAASRAVNEPRSPQSPPESLAIFGAHRKYVSDLVRVRRGGGACSGVLCERWIKAFACDPPRRFGEGHRPRLEAPLEDLGLRARSHRGSGSVLRWS